MKKQEISTSTIGQAQEMMDKNKINVLWYFVKDENGEIVLKARYHEWDKQYNDWYITLEHEFCCPPFLPSYLLKAIKPNEVLCFEIDEFDNIEEYESEKEKQRFKNFISYEPNSKQNI